MLTAIYLLQVSLQPVQVLSSGAEEEKGEIARLVSVLFYCIFILRLESYYIPTVHFANFNFFFQSSFVGAIAIGDLIKSTLGPKGMVSNIVLVIQI